MKKSLFLFALASIVFFSSCEKAETVGDFQDADGLSLKKAHMMMNFQAHLSGDQEVPANESKATGQTIFKLSKDGMELSYKLIVANLEDVRMAHIHLAPVGENGGVVVWLYPPAAPPVLIPGTSNGILAEGVITEANLIGALAGKPLSALTEKMMADSAYVNVHTVMYGGGEIRGQIK